MKFIKAVWMELLAPVIIYGGLMGGVSLFIATVAHYKLFG